MMGDPDWEIWLILALQSSADWLQTVMRISTWMGNPQAYMFLIALVYWAFDSRLGIRMALFLEIGASVTGIMKLAFHAPRPFWVDPRIEVLHPASGFGMPSGHAQSATVWFLIGNAMKKMWFWITAIAIAFMIGLSRAFLGVHFPGQILAGWMLGVILFGCFIRFELQVIQWFQKMNLIHQLLLIAGISLILLSAGLITAGGLRNWTLPLEWIGNASVHGPFSKPGLLSYSTAAVLGNTGGFLGAAAGAILIGRSGGFTTSGVWWKRLFRCILGFSLLGTLYLTLTLLSPDESNAALFGLWRFCGYLIMLFSGIYLIPLLFMKLKLAGTKN